MKKNLKSSKVKSIKEQREELEKELRRSNAKINETKKKVSQLEVQLE